MRFKSRNGVRDPPTPVMFKDGVLQQRVFLGSMAYQMREYIKPPLHCYNCQRFGHVAGSCRGKRKCAKCGGDHAIQNCKAEAPKCPNCDGDHAAGFRCCERFVQAKRVQEVKDQNNMSYAEAAQRVARERGDVSAGTRVVLGSQITVPNLPSAFPSDMLIFNKESFLSFVSDVLVGAKKAANRSDIIRLLVGQLKGSSV